MQEIISFIVETASAWGYLGIIILMTLESCFIPFPSAVKSIKFISFIFTKPAGIEIY